MTTTLSARAKTPAKPKKLAPEQANSRRTKVQAKPNSGSSVEAPFDHGQMAIDTHSGSVVIESTSPPANVATEPLRAARAGSKAPKKAIAQPKPSSPSPSSDPYAGLNFASQVLDDLEGLRIANENRLRQMTRGVEDSDGEQRGLGFGEDHPSVVAMTNIVQAMHDMEALGIKELERLMKNHPLGPWAKAQRGIGYKQVARLIGCIGDPYIRPAHELEDGTEVPSASRTVSQLWAYCGYSVIGGESQKRRKGTQANWSDDARKRAFLIATSCVKQPAGTKWRDLYDFARAKYADATHPVACNRCGPKGKPAQPGSPLSAGHQHARALRLMSKELLKELWIESKRIHESN